MIKLLRRCRELRAENDKLRRENEEYQRRIDWLEHQLYNMAGGLPLRSDVENRTTPLNAYEWAKAQEETRDGEEQN